LQAPAAPPFLDFAL